MATVELLTAQELEERRRQILTAIGGNEESLRERAQDYLLTADELAALTELDEIDWLLRGAA